MHFEETKYVACECDEQTYEQVIGYICTVGNHESFVCETSDFETLPGGLKNKINTDMLFIML